MIPASAWECLAAACVHPATACERPVAACVHPATACERPAAACAHPATACERPAAACVHPAAACERPATACVHPATACERPAAACVHQYLHFRIVPEPPQLLFGYPSHIDRNYVTQNRLLELTRKGKKTEIYPSQPLCSRSTQFLGEIAETVTYFCTLHYICSLSVSHMFFRISASVVVNMLLF